MESSLQNYLVSSLNVQNLVSQLPKTPQEIVYLEILIDVMLNQDKGQSLFDFLLNDYPKFLKSLNSSILSLLILYFQSNDIKKPDFLTERNLYCFPNFKRFPIYDSSLSDYEYKQFILNKKKGKILSLNSIQVLKIYPPECYLYLQAYLSQCSCDKENNFPYLKNNFLNILKNNYENLKNSIRKKNMKCKICDKPFIENEKARIFLNCQKIEVFISDLYGKNKFNNQKKTVDLWLTNQFINKIPQGAKFSAICYFYMNINYNLQNRRYFGSLQEYFVLLSAHFTNSMINKNFFEDLKTKFIEKESIKKNQENLFNDWVFFKDIANSLATNNLPKNQYISLRISVLASIFLKNRDFLKYINKKNDNMIINPSFPSIIDEYNLHLCFISDNESIIFRTIIEIVQKVDNFGIWPYNTDEESLNEFLLHMQNGIILILDSQRLRKNEIYLISKILRRDDIEIGNSKIQINCSIWMFLDSQTTIIKKKDKNNDILTIKDLLNIETYDYFDIVLDLTRKNNHAKKINNNFDKYFVDFFLEKFEKTKKNDFSYEYSEELINKKSNKIYLNWNNKSDYHDDSYIEQGFVIKNEKGINWALNPSKLMQNYFKIARKAKIYSIGNYNSFRKVTNSLTLIREYFKSKENHYKLQNNNKIALIDVIIAILFDEMTTSNKYKETDNSNNSVAFGTVKNSKIGNFLMNLDKGNDVDFDEKLLENKENLHNFNEKMELDKKEKEKKAFMEIYDEIIELCGRVENKEF